MTDIKLFLKRSAIAAVSLALIVPGLAFFSLADDEEQESGTITSTDGMVETYVPIPTTTTEAGGNGGFNIVGTDGETSVSFNDGGYIAYATVQTGDTAPTSSLSDSFSGSRDIYTDNTDETQKVTASVAHADQGDPSSTLVTYTVANGTTSEQTVYIGSGAYLAYHQNYQFDVSADHANGLTVVSKDENYELKITPGDSVSSFDGIWNGSEHPSTHIYEDGHGTGSSNIAYSWKVTVPAGQTYSRSALLTMLKKVLVPAPAPSDSSDSSSSSDSSDSSDSSSGSDDIPIEIVEDPNVTDIQVQLVSTQAGGALPNEELGTATVPTKTLKLELSTISNAQFVSAVQDGIKDIPQGGSFVLDIDQVGCFNTGIIEALEQRRDIEVTVIFVSEGQRTKVVIPAGYDVRQLLDEKGYCGFLRLAALLGSTPV